MHLNGFPVACLINRPVLLEGVDFYFKGYQELKSERVAGLTAGQIPWSSIIKWCEVYQIHDINDIDAVIRYIRAMENAEYEFDQSKNKD